WEELGRRGADSAEVGGTTVRRGTYVRLRPKAGGDIFDLALADRVARVESIEEDSDGRVHATVTLVDDPGADLGAARVLGHRFFFGIDEVEPLDGFEPATPARPTIL